MPEAIPVGAQLTVVNKIVLPLLERMNISVTVTTKPKGMGLDLTFNEPASDDTEPVMGTDSPDAARQLWELREKIQAERRKHGLDNAE